MTYDRVLDMRIWCNLALALLLLCNVQAQRPDDVARLNLKAESQAPSASATRAKPAFLLRLDSGTPTSSRSINPSIFRSPKSAGWSVLVHLNTLKIASGTALLILTNETNHDWLEAQATGSAEEARIVFLLHADYNPDPLAVGVPIKILDSRTSGDFLLRYEGYRLDLYFDGVLVDQEWPIGEVKAGSEPQIRVSSPISRVAIWNSALSDSDIASMNGGAEKVAARTIAILGPEPQRIQYSGPRGYNTNAGDAMPFYHDGTFHLFFLLDRRHHHSKWRLGAHQWAHISSTDLVHWKHYPLALSIEHQWEGSICTGSVFFHNGRYFAYYATRMPDRSERLGVAESDDGIHFHKTIPTPFAEPASPFIHGPNRDPFVFQVGKQFHMIVTAAIANGSVQNEGALEHLVSNNLSTWSVEREPFITSGSQAQPECSSLFKWGDWYYLLFSLSGTTHYRMSKTPLGPWLDPISDILDGPEAFVMKAAPFTGNRMLLVGFVERDNQYGGDLVFRELLQEKDGSLGTKIPHEMEMPASTPTAVEEIHLGTTEPSSQLIKLDANARIAASVAAKDPSLFAINVESSKNNTDGEKLVFNPGAGTVTWTDWMGRPLRGRLDNVSDLKGRVSIVLTLYGSLADLSINGHRTLIHRLASAQHEGISFTGAGKGVDVSQITVSSIR